MYSRPVLDCPKALWGDPDFADNLIFEPVQQYADDDKTIQVFDEMIPGNGGGELRYLALMI